MSARHCIQAFISDKYWLVLHNPQQWYQRWSTIEDCESSDQRLRLGQCYSVGDCTMVMSWPPVVWSIEYVGIWCKTSRHGWNLPMIHSTEYRIVEGPLLDGGDLGKQFQVLIILVKQCEVLFNILWIIYHCTLFDHDHSVDCNGVLGLMLSSAVLLTLTFISVCRYGAM